MTASASSGRALFALRPDVAYLDHGSFGLLPREILAERARIAAELEAAPAPFFVYDCRAAWTRMRELAASRLGARPEDLALTDNVTDSIDAVLRSLRFAPGDEIVVTSLTYGAVSLAARRIAGPQGAVLVPAALRFPDPDPEQCVAAVRAAITPRSRLAILDHVTSSTALVLPLAAMTAACRERGLPVLADGAHAPGQVELDVAAIGADWYAANLHKWMFVPRGCGVLWAAPGRQAELSPNVPSWDADDPFPANFAWTGTRDPTAWLCIPQALAFIDRFGAAELRARNVRTVRDGAALLADAWGVRSGTPDAMTGAMTLAPLPDGLPFAGESGRLALQEALWRDHGVAVSASFVEPGGRIWLRVSGQIYNAPSDYERLADAVLALRR